MTKHERALVWIHRFIGLRPTELARLIWPGQVNGRKQAERLARELEAAGQVIVRELPRGTGKLLVLAEPGARRLRALGHEGARSGKDYGETTGMAWRPPWNWQHELFAAGFLSLAVEAGQQIMTEAELRRRYGSQKWPDGIVLAGNEAWWVEIENARKTGDEMHRLADTLASIARGNLPQIEGRSITKILICLDPHSRDERDFFLDHRQRVTNAIRRRADVPVPLIWSYMHLSDVGGVVGYDLEDETIFPDPVMKRIDQVEWEGPIGKAGKYTIRVFQEQPNCWTWIIEREDEFLRTGWEQNKTKAKRAATENLLELERST